MAWLWSKSLFLWEQPLIQRPAGRILEFGKQTRGKLGGLYEYMLWFLHDYFPYRSEYRKFIQEINQAGSENLNTLVVELCLKCSLFRCSPIYTWVVDKIMASLSLVPDPQHFAGWFLARFLWWKSDILRLSTSWETTTTAFQHRSAIIISDCPISTLQKFFRWNNANLFLY